MKSTFTDACFLISTTVELGILITAVMSLHIPFFSWNRCSGVLSPCMTKQKQIKLWLKRLRTGSLGEGFPAIPQLALRSCSETRWVLVPQLSDQALSIPVFVIHISAGNSLVFSSERNVVVELCYKDMRDAEYHKPKKHTVLFPTLGQGQLSIETPRRYSVTFICPLLMPMLSKESDQLLQESFCREFKEATETTREPKYRQDVKQQKNGKEVGGCAPSCLKQLQQDYSDAYF